MKWSEASVRIIESFNSKGKSGHALAALGMLLVFLLLVAVLVGAGGHEALRQASHLIGN